MRTLYIIFIFTLFAWINSLAQSADLTLNEFDVQQYHLVINEETINSFSYDQQKKTSHWLIEGIVGFGAGAITTAIIVHTGGSTALCNRSANQDAASPLGCAALLSGG